MPDLASRPRIESIAANAWDVLVVGGGITGAGIMREVARLGKRVLLVERGDFASGTSSRSSKIIHGGFHYLQRLQFGLVRDAVHEREQMLHAGSGLAQQVNFFLLTPGSYRPAWLVEFGLSLYDILGGRVPARHGIDLQTIRAIAPGIEMPPSTVAFIYQEAGTDDARLVLRVLMEGCRMGGVALNYVEACDPLLDAEGQVIGLRLLDRETGRTVDARSRVTINATGPWTDRLRAQVGAPPRVRLVRGSHLIFPRSRLPLADVIAAPHPDSYQPLYFVPWEGVTLVGSTNEDQAGLDCDEARITSGELDYLMNGVRMLFPSAHIGREDILCTFSGLRPIVDHGHADAATASREDAIWTDSGMLTVAGGKLTTFRSMALKALRSLRERMPDLPPGNPADPILESLPAELSGSNGRLNHNRIRRYGAEGMGVILASSPDEQADISGFGFSKAELRWVLRKEAVLHLEDLLLRRFRVGLTLRHGGIPYVENIRGVVQSELGWADSRWISEVEAYSQIYARAHGVPNGD